MDKSKLESLLIHPGAIIKHAIKQLNDSGGKILYVLILYIMSKVIRDLGFSTIPFNYNMSFRTK